MFVEQDKQKQSTFVEKDKPKVNHVFLNTTNKRKASFEQDKQKKNKF